MADDTATVRKAARKVPRSLDEVIQLLPRLLELEHEEARINREIETETAPFQAQIDEIKKRRAPELDPLLRELQDIGERVRLFQERYPDLVPKPHGKQKSTLFPGEYSYLRTESDEMEITVKKPGDFVKKALKEGLKKFLRPVSGWVPDIAAIRTDIEGARAIGVIVTREHPVKIVIKLPRRKRYAEGVNDERGIFHWMFREPKTRK
jgi:phage host-nuclease inhibitor protein Gam